jgi:hypothetical protein
MACIVKMLSNLIERIPIGLATLNFLKIFDRHYYLSVVEQKADLIRIFDNYYKVPSK